MSDRVHDLSKEEKERLEKALLRADEFVQSEELELMRQPLEGQLLKFTNVVQGWQGRWFVLDPDKGEMRYYLKEEHKQQNKVRGTLPLVGAVVSPSDEDWLAFTVNPHTGDNYKLKASTTRQRQEWINRLRTISEDQSKRRQRTAEKALLHAPPSKEPSDSVKRGTAREAAVLHQLHKVLAIAAEQQQAMYRAIDTLPQNDALQDNVLLLKATSQSLLDSLEQCKHMMVNLSAEPPRTHSQSQTSEPMDMFDVAAAPVQSGIELAQDAALLSQPVNAPKDGDELPDTDNFVDSELGAIESYKSQILSLLSRLKLGTDLTRLSLPSFILQSRSFLESLSDFLANSDLLVSIAEASTPEQRMVQLVTWYITSFCAGCKDGLVKKPFNPVLGEVFQCSWTTNHNAMVKVFAEQVSHHPPVSALYAVCDQKALHLNVYVWPKSKFMGMSISAAMVGQATLLIGTRPGRPAELYRFDLPTAYGRSILSTPWLELGGKVQLSCAQTSVSASITFHTKPFYGGKLHRVNAEVRNAVGTVVCKIQGEWNKQLELSYIDGRTEIVNSSMHWGSVRMIRPLDKQQHRESRKIWRDVTSALRASDLEKASERRRVIEEMQRRRTKEQELQYVSKNFHQTDSGAWIHNDFPAIFDD